MHQFPRQFHSLTKADQASALGDAPPLTGNRWDELLAEVVEHIARLHGHPVPDWANEPTRFLEASGEISTNPIIAADSILDAPEAFIQPSVFPVPSDLDKRGGEEHAWIP